MNERAHIDSDERRRRLVVRHRLAPERRSDDVAVVCNDLVCLHSSDPTTVYLSVAARMRNPSIEATERALYEERTLIRHHAMRRTLWVFGHEVLGLAHASSTTRLARQERARLVAAIGDSGFTDDPDGWFESARSAVLDVLDEHGAMTARQLGEALPLVNVPVVLGARTRQPVTQSAHSRLLLVLGFEGAVVRTRPTGSWINGQYRWSSMRSWHPDGLDEIDVDVAAAALAERWLRTFGPAPLADLQWWAGWTKTMTTRALATCGAVEVDLDDGVIGWIAAGDDAVTAEPEHSVVLLPGLDPTIMGWKQRDWYLDPDHADTLFDRNGNGGPCVMVGGRVVGGWVQRRDGHIAVRLLDDVGRDTAGEIADVAHRLQDVLGDTRFKTRFPAPLQTDLFEP